MSVAPSDFPDLTCNVCDQRPALGVFSMPGVPISFAYCEVCSTANAHPYEAVVANTAACGGLHQTADWWREIVEATLAHLGISRVKFDDDVELCLDDYRQMWKDIE